MVKIRTITIISQSVVVPDGKQWTFVNTTPDSSYYRAGVQRLLVKDENGSSLGVLAAIPHLNSGWSITSNGAATFQVVELDSLDIDILPDSEKTDTPDLPTPVIPDPPAPRQHITFTRATNTPYVVGASGVVEFNVGSVDGLSVISLSSTGLRVSSYSYTVNGVVTEVTNRGNSESFRVATSDFNLDNTTDTIYFSVNLERILPRYQEQYNSFFNSVTVEISTSSVSRRFNETKILDLNENALIPDNLKIEFDGRNTSGFLEIPFISSSGIDSVSVMSTRSNDSYDLTFSSSAESGASGNITIDYSLMDRRYEMLTIQGIFLFMDIVYTGSDHPVRYTVPIEIVNELP